MGLWQEAGQEPPILPGLEPGIEYWRRGLLEVMESYGEKDDMLAELGDKEGRTLQTGEVA